MSLFQNKYRVEPARLKHFDYGSNAAYYITICTKNRINYFGKIVEMDNYPSHLQEQKKDNYLPKIQNQEAINLLSKNSNVETDNYPSLQATEIGVIAKNYWEQIPEHFPFVILDEFVVMPNHIHGIIIINKPVETDNYLAQNNTTVETDNYLAKKNTTLETDNYLALQKWKPNQFGPQSQNLGSIIRGFKSSVKRYANQNNIEFEWQPKYWDRVIRNELELTNIRTYIHNNPQNWINDENYKL